jgi:GT2 family glycosyltransferase
MADKAAIDSHRVTAILVVHDGAVWLPEVVASIASQTRSVDQLIAVDTGSIDSSSKLLKGAKIPTLSVDRELGFGDAVQSAVDKLPTPITGASEWLWLLHDDCAPTSTALEKLLAAIQERPQVVMAGPKLLGWHKRTHLLEVGVSIAGNGARWTGLENSEYDQGQHDGIKDVLAVSTAGALIRRDVFEELGGFDSELALFRDDVDFGWRARVAGHSVIVATDAIAFHAQASATERRSVDVDGAFLQRPLLLDRRNAAYVLLANSSWWMLPWLVLQLLSSAISRSLVFLLSKLPGYASDELLAVASLLLRPGIILKARKNRKKTRLVSPRVIAPFIPPRWSQLRLSISNIFEKIRERLLPLKDETTQASIEINEDEDLLVPHASTSWTMILKKSQFVSTVSILLFSFIWSRNRFGTLAGGALPSTNLSAMDLWRTYVESWHQVGMGSTIASPPWIAIIALLSGLFFGKTALFITIFFYFAPLLMMISSYFLFLKFSLNKWLAIACGFLYAISPMSVASINSGRLGGIASMIILPLLARLLINWKTLAEYTWRRIWSVGLLISLLYSFSLTYFLIFLVIAIAITAGDFRKNKILFTQQTKKMIALVLSPFLVTLPYSFEALLHPARFFAEPGLSIPVGYPNLVITGNPGGPGSLPWWLISPILLMLLSSLFSSSKARYVAEAGIAFLLVATMLSIFSFTNHGNSAATKVWTGSFLAVSTLASCVAAVIILDKLREVLRNSHVHHRHYLAALLIIATIFYSIAAISWTFLESSNSQVNAQSVTVVPEFLGIQKNTKTLVLRQMRNNGINELQYAISTHGDLLLGQPDVAPPQNPALDVAVRELIDGSGISASDVFSRFGIRYLFVKAPFKEDVVRAIDGLGGFTRTSATPAGIIWKISGSPARLSFVDTAGKKTILESGDIGARVSAPSAGTLTLAENFSRSWRILQDGKYLVRTKNADGLPTFTFLHGGEFSLIHDGTSRRGWLSLEFIALLTLLVLALPGGRRKVEISEEVLA